MYKLLYNSPVLSFSLCFMAFAVILSFVSHGHNMWNLVILVGMGIAIFAISLARLEIGIWILFGELFFGSRGHLFEYGFISLRLVVFVAVFLGWMVNRIINQELRIMEDLRGLPKMFWLLILVIVAGGVYGFIAGNGPKNVFLDTNGYLYFAILPAVASVIRGRDQVEKIFEILKAAIIAIALLTLVLFMWFAFSWPGVATMYHWVINQDLGEITGLLGNASRIFLQSQFFSLVGLFVFFWKKPRQWFVLAAAVFAILMSLSRSFWLGGGVAAFFLIMWVIFFARNRFGILLKGGVVLILIAVLEIGGVFAITKFSGGGFSQAITSRGMNPTTEAAGGARLMLLPELMDEIRENPLLGKGFGRELTYKSYLPDRVTPENPDGEITTYAFEWGYLDIWLKIGLVGLIIYLTFAAKIFSLGMQNLKVKIQNLGIISGLVALLILNITTPYLNHPLGIGYLILAYLSFTAHD